jgi:hypothetical protein
VNFSPIDDKPASSEEAAGAESSSPPSSGGSSANGNGGGIPKEVVVQELLNTKEVNKPDNVQASVFAKALIGRYLCVLFKDSVHCRTRFSDSTNTSLYTVRRTSEAERDSRLQEVPAFPQDLRVKILQELKEERLGRTSARNLLQLMTQPPSSATAGSKKPRLETSVSTPHLTTRAERLSPHSPSSSLSPSPSSPSGIMSDSQRRSRDGMDLVEAAAAAAAVAPHPSTTTTTAASSGKQQTGGDHHGHTTANRKRRRGSEEEGSTNEKGHHHHNQQQQGPADDDDDDDNDEADESAAEKLRSMPEPSSSSSSRRSSLKRSFSMSSAAAAAAEASAASAENGRPAQRMRLGETSSGSNNPKGTLAAEAPSPKGSLAAAAEASSFQQQGLLAPMSGVAAMGRMLRRQVSTPVLPTQIRASPAVGGGSSATVQQEPWKREINDLWAKQLAMMREINTLKNELGRREAARQREILGLRQEIDGLRGTEPPLPFFSPSFTQPSQKKKRPLVSPPLTLHLSQEKCLGSAK